MRNLLKILLVTVLILRFSETLADTLMDSLNSAYLNNPKLNAERAKMRSSIEEKRESVSEFLPSVTISGYRSEQDNTKGSSADSSLKPKENSMVIEQKIFQGGSGVANFVKKKHGLELTLVKLVLSQTRSTMYARDDAHKDELMEKEFMGRGKVEISRFKGLGEMPPAQLKETTMDPARRTLVRVTIPAGQTDDEIIEAKYTARLVDNLMGKNPEKRFKYIQENASLVEDIDV